MVIILLALQGQPVRLHVRNSKQSSGRPWGRRCWSPRILHTRCDLRTNAELSSPSGSRQTAAEDGHGWVSKVARLGMAFAASLTVALSGAPLAAAQPSSDTHAEMGIETVRSTLLEAWWKVNHIYYDTTFNNKDWDQVLKASLDEVDHAPDPAAAYAAIPRMLAQLGDQYTRVLPPSKTLSYKEDTAGVVVHVGLRLRSGSGQALRVAYVAPGSAAQEAGVRLGDTLLAINGRFATDVPKKDYPALLRNDCDLKLRRDASDSTLDYDVHLAALPIEVYPVTTATLHSPGAGLIGYVRLTSFGEHTGRDTEGALRQLEAAGAKTFILDLRGNTGGLVSAGYDVAHTLLHEGQVFCIMRSRAGEDVVLQISDQQHNMTAPMVVLVDGETASTSETLAGALQAQGRALLLGERTFGKGRTQQIVGLQDGSTLIVTRNLISTPAHALIDKVGLKPDLACKGNPATKAPSGPLAEASPLSGDPCITLAKRILARTPTADA